jgi:hypothetical protein
MARTSTHISGMSTDEVFSADERKLSRPDTDKGKLQRKLLSMLRARELIGMLPTNIRFLFYELVQARAIAKHREDIVRRTDIYVSEAVMHLREVGLIGWDWIVDETRQLDSWRFAASARQYLIDTVPLIRIDAWDGEPAPMILTESRSLAGVLRNVAGEYLCPIAATNGQVGGFLHTDVAPALEPGQRVLYLGDLDLSGGQIEANTRRRLEEIVGGGLEWERTALTRTQYDDMPEPKPEPVVKRDRRYKDAAEGTHEAIETETLGQELLVEILRRRLDEMLPEPLEDVLARQRRQQEKIRTALRRMRVTR